jgi:ribonuclease-3
LAVTHSSYAAEHDCTSNELLEFLGDAVVDLAIADLIVTAYPGLDEGSGSLVRSRVVNEASLARAAQRLDLASCIRIGRGEVKSKGLERPSLLADAFEAVVAAIYLDNGYGAAKEFVQAELGDDVATASLSPDDVDPKTRLRKWAEASARGVPVYEVTSDGPAHDTTFHATVHVGDTFRASAQGRSKKIAEGLAAEAAWERRHDA